MRSAFGDIVVRDLVLVGGGHAHVHVLKSLGMQPLPGVQTTLITRDIDTPYSGMLPGHIAGHYTREMCHLDLQKLARFANARLVHASVTGLDLEGRYVYCNDGRPPLPYDCISLDIGSTPRMPHGIDPSRLKHVAPVKPIDGFSQRWESILSRVTSAAAEARTTRLVVVGGGAAGVELVLAMQHRLKQALRESGSDPSRISVTLMHRGATLLDGHGSRTRNTLLRTLREREVQLLLEREAVGVEEGSEGEGGALVCSDGSRVAYDEAVWSTNSGAAAWLRDTGLRLDDGGFVMVDTHLQALGNPGVFAAGDCCHIDGHARPKAGVFAVRAGIPLADNLRAYLEGRALREYLPQKSFLGIITTGDRSAVASKGVMSLEGASVWRWKDHIDRTWMDSYKHLPDKGAMAASASGRGNASHALAVIAAGPEAVAAAERAAMRCGGCGSKVGATVLTRVLGRLRRGSAAAQAGGKANTMLLGDDDAAVVPFPPEAEAAAGSDQLRHLRLVHTVDYFRSFVSDPFVFGKIAARHALSDVHAMGARPTTALAVAVVPYAGERQVESALEQAMAGAATVLEEEGCALVGGHSAEGAELALGFSVNGVARADSLTGKRGAKPGDVLILTKALGTGAVLAADMRGKATGAAVMAAISSMLAPAGPAAEALRRCGAHAVTDVTGFGLVGHLVEMLRAEETNNNGRPAENNNGGIKTAPPLGAKLRIDALPVLEGALEAMGAGMLSSLHAENVRAASLVADAEAASDHPLWALLFDPQTAGPLLAAVPPEAAERCLNQLRRECGCAQAAAIGEVVALPGGAAEPQVWAALLDDAEESH